MTMNLLSILLQEKNKIEGYPEPILQFIIVDAEKGEVLFTSTKHGYAEEWEDEEEL